jgi:hypothetical protein
MPTGDAYEWYRIRKEGERKRAEAAARELATAEGLTAPDEDSDEDSPQCGD